MSHFKLRSDHFEGHGEEERITSVSESDLSFVSQQHPCLRPSFPLSSSSTSSDTIDESSEVALISTSFAANNSSNIKSCMSTNENENEERIVEKNVMELTEEELEEESRVVDDYVNDAFNMDQQDEDVDNPFNIRLSNASFSLTTEEPELLRLSNYSSPYPQHYASINLSNISNKELIFEGQELDLTSNNTFDHHDNDHIVPEKIISSHCNRNILESQFKMIQEDSIQIHDKEDEEKQMHVPDQGFRKEQQNDDIEGQNREIDILEKRQVRQSEAHQTHITNTFTNDHHRQEHLNFDIDLFDEEQITPSLIKENKAEDTKENDNKNRRIPSNVDSNKNDNNNNNNDNNNNDNNNNVKGEKSNGRTILSKDKSPSSFAFKKIDSCRIFPSPSCLLSQWKKESKDKKKDNVNLILKDPKYLPICQPSDTILYPVRLPNDSNNIIPGTTASTTTTDNNNQNEISVNKLSDSSNHEEDDDTNTTSHQGNGNLTKVDNKDLESGNNWRESKVEDFPEHKDDVSTDVLDDEILDRPSDGGSEDLNSSIRTSDDNNNISNSLESSRSTKVNDESTSTAVETNILRQRSPSPPQVRKSIVSKEHLRPSDIPYPDGKKYVCRFPGCTYRTKYTFGLKRHIETRHAKEGEIIWHRCRYEGCEYKTRQRSNLGRHVKDHHEKDRRKDYICDVPGCKSSFKRSDHLSRHKKTVHFNMNKKRPYRTRAQKLAEVEVMMEKSNSNKTVGSAIPLYYNTVNADSSMNSSQVKSESNSPYLMGQVNMARFDDISAEVKASELREASNIKYQYMKNYPYARFPPNPQQQEQQHRYALMQQQFQQQQQQRLPHQRQFVPLAQHIPPKQQQYGPGVFMDNSNTSHSGTNGSLASNLPSQGMQPKEALHKVANLRFPNQPLNLDSINRKREPVISSDELYASSRPSSQQSHHQYYMYQQQQKQHPQMNTSPSLQPLPSKRPRINDVNLSKVSQIPPGHIAPRVPAHGPYPNNYRAPFPMDSHPQQQKGVYPNRVPAPGMPVTREYELDGSNPGMKRPISEMGRFNDTRAYINKNVAYENVDKTHPQGMPRVPVNPNTFRVRGIGEERDPTTV